MKKQAVYFLLSWTFKYFSSMHLWFLKYLFFTSISGYSLISVVCNGASDMLSSVSGLVRLQKKFPQLILWHCVNHHLELTVGDVVSKLTQINYMRNFFDKLYSLYHASPKNINQLQQCALDLSTKVQAVEGF